MVALARREAPVLKDMTVPAGHILAVKASADAHTLSRIVDVLVVRDILPDQLSCQHVGEWLVIDMQLPATSEERGELVLHKIRGLPGVLRASFADRRHV